MLPCRLLRDVLAEMKQEEEEEEVHVAPAAAAATAQHHVVAGGGHGQVNRMAEWSECPPCTGKVGGSNPGSRKLKTFN